MTRTDLRIKFNKDKDLQVLQTDGTGYIHYTDDYVHWLEEIAQQQANDAQSKDIKLHIKHVDNIFAGYCDFCEETTQHRVIHACQKCSKNL